MEDDISQIITNMNLQPQEGELLRETHYIISRILEDTDGPELYADPTQILRFLRARDFDQEQAVVMWDKWRQWRVDNRIDRMKLREVAAVMSTGLWYIHGHDKQMRPCVVIRTRNHNPGSHPVGDIVKFAVYIIERAVALSDKYGSRQVSVIYDRDGQTSANRDPELMKVTTDLATMFQDYYAERLACFYVLHVNWFYKTMWTLAKPLLAQKTRDKIEILSDPSELLKYFDSNQLAKEYGGTSEYVHPFPAF